MLWRCGTLMTLGHFMVGKNEPERPQMTPNALMIENVFWGL